MGIGQDVRKQRAGAALIVDGVGVGLPGCVRRTTAGTDGAIRSVGLQALRQVSAGAEWQKV